MTTRQRNPRWSRDEIILALDIYFDLDGKNEESGNPRVAELSQRLQVFAPAGIRPEQKFRNENSVALKLQNLRHYDNARTGGLSGGGKLDELILKEFYNKRDELKRVANAIIESLAIVIPPEVEPEYDDPGAPEGRRLQRLHFYIERNRTLVEKKKKQVKKANGKLSCEVCAFDFLEFYGPVGEDFIECHHIIPLSLIKKESLTKLKDYMLLCPNCHRMIHKTKDCNLDLLKAGIEKAVVNRMQ